MLIYSHNHIKVKHLNLLPLYVKLLPQIKIGKLASFWKIQSKFVNLNSNVLANFKHQVLVRSEVKITLLNTLTM